MGGAVVLFVAAVAVSAVLSFGAGGGGAQGEIVRVEGDGAGGAAPGVGATGGVPPATGAAAMPTILVHVLGAVAEPGIVELTTGARVVDAIGAAGGLAGDADPAGVNLARVLVDGEQLVVPREGEVPQPAAVGGGGSTVAGSDGRVSINRADVAALDTLPRIGPALAQRIIDWREANGPFTDVSQLMEVAGIGDAVYSGLVDLVSL
ncbi:ComEA family DNA-binding protein [Agromyces sp. Q22]|uniref:ComEA family DNA-binding protein n=1 Tax=Agromyces kandeliae TaxID=2666141 RepID=A0A6L5QXB4_9MICO|nr:ComEA family DNA-binding protein [Agromyces kandeliae]